MGRGARHLGAATAILIAVAALSGAIATAAGPAVEKVKLAKRLGSPEGVVAYGESQLLLLGGYGEDAISRVGEDGAADPSFGTDGQVEIKAEGVAVAPDGKILVAGCGEATDRPENRDGQVTRLMSDGSADPSFGTDGSVLIDFGGGLDCADSVAVTADGDILVGGDRSSVDDSIPAFARLNPDGALDSSFGEAGVRVLQSNYLTGIYDVAPTPDGGVLGIGEDLGVKVWKLTAAGSLDRSFGSGGAVEVPGHGRHGIGGGHPEPEMLSELAVLPSGKILLGGTDTPSESAYYRAVALRLLPNGHRDRGYGRNGWAVWKTANSTFVGGMTVLPGGVLVLAAASHHDREKRSAIVAIAFGPSGKPDPRFGHRGHIRLDLRGFDEVEAERTVTTLGRRAVILAEQGKGKGTWLVTSRPLRGG